MASPNDSNTKKALKSIPVSIFLRSLFNLYFSSDFKLNNLLISPSLSLSTGTFPYYIPFIKVA